MDKKEEFLTIFKLAKKKYGRVKKRLAGEGWNHPWQTLIATIYSAQARDELTIPVMESAFAALPRLADWANAPVETIEELTRKSNYYRTKSRNAKACAAMLLSDFNGVVPETIEELITLPGVGRKTANLMVSEVFGKPGICVDTHVHRISNVFGFVSTKAPNETEIALRGFVPKRYWSQINRIFVLWGKDVPGWDKERLLAKLREK